MATEKLVAKQENQETPTLLERSTRKPLRKVIKTNRQTNLLETKTNLLEEFDSPSQGTFEVIKKGIALFVQFSFQRVVAYEFVQQEVFS